MSQITRRRLYLNTGRACTWVSWCDFKALNEYNWTIDYCPGTHTHKGYPYRKFRQPDGTRKKVYLHHFIMGQREGFVVDHANRDRLDNTRENLRFLTPGQNQLNKESKLGTSRHKGVHWNKKRRKYIARITVGDGARKYVGSFHTQKEAAQAYDVAILTYLNSPFSYTNYPVSSYPQFAHLLPADDGQGYEAAQDIPF